MRSKGNDKNIIHPKLILLDVYETILDMSEMEKRVNAMMKSKRGYIIWFGLFMQYSFVDNCIVQFHNFQTIADASLKMTSQILKCEISSEDVQGILELMKHLPLKENVQAGLSLLHEENYRIAALTNSPERIVIDRMDRTGLISYFERVFSAEHMRKYKPAIEVYRWVAESVGLNPAEIMVVTAHGWDIAGAENAGMQTAYVVQAKEMLYPLAPQPDFICSDLVNLHEKLHEAKS